MREHHWQVVRVVALLLFAVGCGEDEIVYVDRPPFNTAVDSTSGLLGYYSASTKQTTCGNCHAGHQADWAKTHHSNAFSTLVASGHATASCYTCHTVTQNGNGLPGPAGYNKTPDATYQDVQCESCHGPGTEHVKKTEVVANVPLARLTLSKANQSCAACHTGIHTPFAEEWATSGHAKLQSAAINNTTSNCKNCHEGKTALKVWGVVTNYEERDSATVYSPHTCAVCHNPHGSENNAQLRYPINTVDPDFNLCTKCHLNRGAPTTSSNTPHGATGYTLLGISGYRPAGITIDTAVTITTHASEANPRFCAGCHVIKFDVTDPATGAFVFHSTGHSFKPIPCVDGTGKPTGNNNCAYSTTARTWRSCTTSGCHGSATVAAGLLTTSRNTLKQLADLIWIDTDGDKTLDPAPIDAGYLATIQRDRPGEFTNSNTLTPAEGALFNVKLFGEARDGHEDGSFGVHNPILARTLLAANVNELRAYYVLPAPPAALQELIVKTIADAKVRSPNFITTTPTPRVIDR